MCPDVLEQRRFKADAQVRFLTVTMFLWDGGHRLYHITTTHTFSKSLRLESNHPVLISAAYTLHLTEILQSRDALTADHQL